MSHRNPHIHFHLLLLFPHLIPGDRYENHQRTMSHKKFSPKFNWVMSPNVTGELTHLVIESFKAIQRQPTTQG
jgi:hypothetical protein